MMSLSHGQWWRAGVVLAFGWARQRGSVDLLVGMTNSSLQNDKIRTKHRAQLYLFLLHTTSSYEFHIKTNKITQQQHSCLLHMCIHAHELLLQESLCMQLKRNGKNGTSWSLSNPLSVDMLHVLTLNIIIIIMIVISGAQSMRVISLDFRFAFCPVLTQVRQHTVNCCATFLLQGEMFKWCLRLFHNH